MTDLRSLVEYINLVTLGICLCVGFSIKYAKIFDWLGNQYIPLTMLILGSVINILINIPNINATVVLGGMISGLASTGLYEMMRNLLDKDGKSEDL